MKLKPRPQGHGGLSVCSGQQELQAPPVQESAELDQKRRALIAERILPALKKFFDGSMPLTKLTLGPDRLQRLFFKSGILSAQDARVELGLV